MALLKPKREDLTIVLLGDFNPKIFQPVWFASEGLIKESESDDADIEIIRPEISVFQLDWLKLNATRDRFVVETNKDPYFEVVRDLVVGTFRTLSHTPIRMMGVNLKRHYTMPSEKAWHQFGDILAPKELWTGILEKPGLNVMTIESPRPDKHKGYIRVTTGPEEAIGNLYVQVNDHFAVVEKQTDNVLGCNEIIDILEAEWVASMARSAQIIDSLMERTL